jgi:hypothetical protein
VTSGTSTEGDAGVVGTKVGGVVAQVGPGIAVLFFTGVVEVCVGVIVGTIIARGHMVVQISAPNRNSAEVRRIG